MLNDCDFHYIFVRVLRFCIKYKRFFSIIHILVWKLSYAICFFVHGINNFLENSISSVKTQLYLGAKLLEAGAHLRSRCGISNPYLLPNSLVIIWLLSQTGADPFGSGPKLERIGLACTRDLLYCEVGVRAFQIWYERKTALLYP